MKSLRLIKATVKDTILAISIYYIVLIVSLVLTAINSYSKLGLGNTTPLFLFIFTTLYIPRMFTFSQNVCVSRKTCFIAAIYSIVAMASIICILDILFVGLAMLFSIQVSIFTRVTSNSLFLLLVITDYIVIATVGMLFGITWYRLSKFFRICIGIVLGVLVFVGIPFIIRNASSQVLGIVEDIVYSIYNIFAYGDIWTILANLVLAAILASILYLVIRKAQIKEIA